MTRETDNSITRGVCLIADAVRFTLGPNGRNAVIERPFKAPLITGDSAAIIREFDSVAAAQENASFQLMRSLATNVSDEVGDGAATAIVLAQAIILEGFKNITAGSDPAALSRGIHAGADSALRILSKRSRNVRDEGEIVGIASAAAGDEESGEVVADLVKRAGVGWTIAVEESKSMENVLEFVKGVRLERGYISPAMVSDPYRMEAALENPFVLLSEDEITDARDLIPALELVKAAKTSLLIIAGDLLGDALTLLLANHAQGIVHAAAIRAPEFAERRKDVLRDLAALTGGAVFSSDAGMPLREADLSRFGRAEKIVVAKDSTLIEGAKGDEEEIRARVRALNFEMGKAGYGFDRKKLQGRIDKLSGGIAVLRVGAASEAEMADKKLRAEDALCAVKLALQNGVVPGGGVALFHSQGFIYADKTCARLTGDELTGVRILARALEAPLRQIADNAGADGRAVCARLKGHENPAMGFDAVTKKDCDMYSIGVCDPLDVVTAALVNAVSYATMILTCGGIIRASDLD